MMHVRKTNLAHWKEHRGTLQFSQSYQIRENVKSATYLYKCFLVFSIQAVIGWLFIMLYLVFRKLYKVLILEKLFGFVFDASVALFTTTIPLAIIKHNEKLRQQFRMLQNRSKKASNIPSRCARLFNFCTVCPSNKSAEAVTVRTLVDLEGRRINLETREETAAYFNQFSDAWS
ncbi:hypothetical protein OESDEN_14551 [Oesophagostomum dentatum]|uniref:Uncharacterized protein n=1 Tax=Oesophagostomum dentatum TaxID=61180 RepID=A0A0B1SRA7_OESDE|nr:hypothetical protein OESDEN_14551 [Oesophagostomum dentatum]